jgi:hypothetical protein
MYTYQVQSPEERERFHMLPGILQLLVYQSSTTLEGFIMWLRDCILPWMNPFLARHTILVMDNASWHQDGEVYRLCREKGVKLMYLSPYSPDFNPIELFFGAVKAYIRRHAQYTADDWSTDKQFAAFLRDSC